MPEPGYYWARKKEYPKGNGRPWGGDLGRWEVVDVVAGDGEWVEPGVYRCGSEVEIDLDDFVLGPRLEAPVGKGAHDA